MNGLEGCCYKSLTRTLILSIVWLTSIGSGSAHSEIRFESQSPRKINFRPSRLAELAAYLVSSSDDYERREFARIALTELIAAYEAELNRANRAMPKSESAQRKLSQWRYATSTFLFQLQDIYRTFDADASLKIHLEERQRVLMVIGKNPVVISGPRIGYEEALEERIAENFCRIYICTQLSGVGSYIEPKPDYSEPGIWKLSQRLRPRYETRDGLSFKFEDLSNRAMKEQACLKVAVELRELAAALKKARENGERIYWPVLRIASNSVSDNHRVILNERNDYLSLKLDNLVRSDGLWKEFLPWLRSQTQGKEYLLTLPKGERLIRLISAVHH